MINLVYCLRLSSGKGRVSRPGNFTSTPLIKMAEHTSSLSEFASKKRIISTLVKKGKKLGKKGKNETLHADDLDHLLPIVEKLIKHIELHGKYS